jgi:ADP-ribose pyrophosphatase
MRNAEILARADCFRGFFRLERVTLRHDLHAGTVSPAMTREIFGRGDIVAVLPHDPVADKIVLIEQFRPGPLVAGADPWLLEIVAGHVEAGEPHEQAARRETLEETGCEVHGLMQLATYFLAPNFSPDRVHLFVAEVTAPPAPRVCGRGEETEDIRVVPVDRADALALAVSGRITSPWTLMALALADRRDVSDLAARVAVERRD